VLIGALIVCSGLAGALIGALIQGTGSGGASGLAPTPSNATSGSCDTRRIAREVLPAVVTISAKAGAEGGTGSGEIIAADGVVVTNDHVISVAADGGTIEVILSDGVTKPAELVGRDPRTDLAVLRVSTRSDLPTVEFGDSASLSVGEPVVALGAPLGLSGTVTSGIVSALGRDIPVPTGDGGQTVLAGTIQTDASINPGNSGGALVDCTGGLVGVNTAILTVPNEAGHGGGGNVGIGFAVPAETVQSVTSQLLDNGRVAHPTFGMATTPIPESTAEEFGTPPGLFVQSVTKGGPADLAGLQRGDIISTIDGQRATQPTVVLHVLATSSVGDQVEIEYYREGQAHSADLTLAAD
jgi:putative serine protease PepD